MNDSEKEWIATSRYALLAMVALTAIMRKIIVIANARLKELNLQSTW